MIVVFLTFVIGAAYLAGGYLTYRTLFRWLQERFPGVNYLNEDWFVVGALWFLAAIWPVALPTVYVYEKVTGHWR